MTKLRAFDHGDPLLPKGVLPRPLRPYARARRDGQVPLCKCKAGAPEALPAVCHRSRPQQTPSTTTNTLVGQTRSRLCRCGVRLLRRPDPQPLHPSGKSYASKEVGLLSCQVRVSHFSSPPFSRDMCQPGKNEEASTKMGKRFVTRSF